MRHARNKAHIYINDSERSNSIEYGQHGRDRLSFADQCDDLGSGYVTGNGKY